MTDRIVRNAPSVSVIMPVRNEQGFLGECLDAVFAQDYPHDRMEVIIADGESTDGTLKIIQEMQQRHPNLRVINNPGRIVATGLNEATAQAQGDIVIRVDGHCTIDRQYVRRCVERLHQHNADGVGGSIETVGLTPTSKVIATAMSSRFGVGGSQFRTTQNKTVVADTIPFPAYTRSIIQQAGKYDEELVRNQDDEYNYRLRKMGAKLILAADVRSTYYCRSSIRSLYRQFFQYGFWKVRVMQKHPGQMRPRQFAPMLLVVTTIALLLLSLSWPIAYPILGALAALYLAMNLCASVTLAAKHGWPMLIRLPLVFSTIHFAYGLGFLWGLLWFWPRWQVRSDSGARSAQVS